MLAPVALEPSVGRIQSELQFLDGVLHTRLLEAEDSKVFGVVVKPGFVRFLGWMDVQPSPPTLDQNKNPTQGKKQ